MNTNSDDLVRATAPQSYFPSLTLLQTLGQERGPTETDLGKGIVDAAVEAGVQVFVHSGMHLQRK